MKKLFFLLLLLGGMFELSAQHYGGLTFTPYVVENFNAWRSKSYKNTELSQPKTTFGFSVGYQGLLMPEKRFSFSYGLLYSSAYNEAEYQMPLYDETETGRRVDMKSLQLPLWLRYNILKKRKWQPFITISTSINYALVSERTFYYEDSPSESSVMNNGFFLSGEAGIGVNYNADNWMFTVQPTIGGTYARQIGVGFSLLKKF